MLIDRFSFRVIIGTLALFLSYGWMSFANGQTVVGSGPDSSYLILESSLFTVTYEYRYTYDSNNLLSGYDLLTAIDAADADLNLTFVNYGTISDPNFFLDIITYNSQTLANTGFPTYEPYWAQWVSGGRGGFPTQADYDYGYWQYGSGASAPYRTLAPGSSDGYVYNDGFTEPTVSPIPEPHTMGMLLAGFALLAVILHKRCALQKRTAGSR